MPSLVNVLTFSYDANNNPSTAVNNAGAVTMSYDALDRLATLRAPFTAVQTYSYDLADNRLATQDSFSGITTRVYDALNRVTTMLYGGPGQTPLREDFAYTVRDQVSLQRRFSDLAATTTVGYSTMGYDAVGRNTSLQHLNASNVSLANYGNSFDLASRITAETLNAAAPTSYAYDNTDQLTNDAVVTYSYDLNGNRTMAGYSTGPANQLLGDGTYSYGYDANGNQVTKTQISGGAITTYGYDNRNRLTTVESPTVQATYSYDALGQRLQKDVRIGGITTITRFAYDDNRQIWADLNGSNVLQQRYLRGDSVLWLPARISGGGTAAWLLPDRMGSIRNVIDTTGAVIDTITYDGFGKVQSESNAANGGEYKYDGYRYDSETGLFRPDPTVARYYNPLTGRWQTEDPVVFRGGDPNLSRYVKNTPPNALDPFGLQDKMIVQSSFPITRCVCCHNGFAEGFKSWGELTPGQQGGILMAMGGSRRMCNDAKSAALAPFAVLSGLSGIGCAPKKPPLEDIGPMEKGYRIKLNIHYLDTCELRLNQVVRDDVNRIFSECLSRSGKQIELEINFVKVTKEEFDRVKTGAGPHAGIQNIKLKCDLPQTTKDIHGQSAEWEVNLRPVAIDNYAKDSHLKEDFVWSTTIAHEIGYHAIVDSPGAKSWNRGHRYPMDYIDAADPPRDGTGVFSKESCDAILKRVRLD